MRTSQNGLSHTWSHLLWPIVETASVKTIVELFKICARERLWVDKHLDFMKEFRNRVVDLRVDGKITKEKVNELAKFPIWKIAQNHISFRDQMDSLRKSAPFLQS